jgi:hypothetical protein
MTAQASLNWERLPEELRVRAQWLLATPDVRGDFKVPTTVNIHGELVPGSSTARSTWMTFDKAVDWARKFGLGIQIGYVLSFDDPFTCIDLDVKNAHNRPGKPEEWSSAEDIELCTRILYGFDTYAERSQSGQGLHLWCKGKIGAGLKRPPVELYSQERFIVCTGDIVLDRPVQDRQQFLTNMAGQMREAQPRAATLQEVEEEDSDAEIFERAANAANADKFLALCRGEWERSGEYPSQSEADLALMSMFTFYSPSNEQCRRLFRMTALGKRDKATKNDRYLNFTLQLIRARQAQEKRILDRIELTMLEKQGQLALQEIDRLESNTAVMERPVQADSAVAVAQAPAQLAPPPAATPESGTNQLDWPPGLAGALAGFIYRNAPRPVKEVAIVAALGWLAGVCGKAYMISSSGLNMYVILVARSAVGKEAMHTGLSVLTQSLISKGFVAASRFIDYSDFASGPALRKAVGLNESFLNVSGEWGRKLKRLGQEGHSADSPMQTLRTEMTNLYQKSGPQSIVGGMMYSKKEDNVSSINGVNYSMIGETTPGTFYDALTESMMEDGFLSRFTIVEYSGERPAANLAPQKEPEEALLQACGQLCTHTARTLGERRNMVVSMTPAAQQMVKELDDECDAQINKTLDESWRQMWNRAHLKALRAAALLAVGDNPYNPVIDVQHASWAIDLIKRDIRIMKRKIEDGEVGTGDSTRERKLLSLCKQYITPPGPGPGYHIPDAMLEAGVVTRSYLQIRCSRLALFSQAKQGGTRALNEAIQSLVDSGYLMEVDKLKAADSYGFQGRCYRITNLPNGLLS